MWDWVTDTLDQTVEGLTLILQGSMRLLPVAIGLAVLVVLTRWLVKEPEQFIRGWLAFFAALIVFPGGPLLIDSYVYPIEKDSWLFLPTGIGCAYLAYKLFVIVAGLKHSDGSASTSDTGTDN